MIPTPGDPRGDPRCERRLLDAETRARAACRAIAAIFSEIGTPFGITGANVRYLLALADGSCATQSELARLLDVRDSSATAALNDLQQWGLIRRFRHGGDGRRKSIALTRAGRTLVGDLIPRVRARLGSAALDL